MIKGKLYQMAYILVHKKPLLTITLKFKNYEKIYIINFSFCNVYDF